MLPPFVVTFLIGAALGEISGNGSVSTDTADRIINGENAKEGEFPFMVTLRRIKTTQFYCAGTVITKNWIMTAAHCCKADRLRSFYTGTFIRAGTLYLFKGGTNHTIEKIFPHERYEQDERHGHDVCVVRVKEPFAFGKNLQQVVLPNKDFPVNSGDGLIAAGWGKTSNIRDTNRLQKLSNYTGLTNEECGELSWMNMFPGFICAKVGKGKRQGTCFGDSGGPLLKGDVQVGITSFGFIPCGNLTPDFFARVSHYIDWIKDKLGLEASELKIVQ